MLEKIVSPLRIAVFLSLLPVMTLSAGIEDFFGNYSGSATLQVNGEEQRRDLSTTITETRKGFKVSWTSATYKTDGRLKEKTYTIEFLPSERDNIYSSAMATNVFGKAVPLDPLNGEPFVWARLDEDTLSIFSLFINEIGEYEMQEFHRSLAEGGLNLVFKRVHNGATEREIKTFLKRTD